MKTLLIIATLAASLSAQSLSEGERTFAIRNLEESRTALHRALDGLTPAQLTFRPSPEKWSIADNIEHLALIEPVLMRMIKVMLTKPALERPTPDQIAARDAQVLKDTLDRNVKGTAPEVVQPRRTEPPEVLLTRFDEARAQTIEYLRTTQDDLRVHGMKHPIIGQMDCYQWLLSISAHVRRHIAQINEIKRDERYPETRI